ncbi:DUF3526 domain-containing protein [Marinilongibacter aquaticus]|uniref:ABC transporter permease n=1 Tax=Marinilongibacter aquaticus TaxID=2975157 RepID=UPI0021BD658A|nr:DUF3526 domain-containing protein [Marinilongibacter aquaticus]UBM58612.1 DUF3526 domain-containing protein [Marinilongibacter aquaticus]
MIWTIAKKELLILWRNKTFLLAGLIFFSLLAISAISGYNSYLQQQEERLQAEQETKEQWLKQDPKHPHIAAHFGHFAFLPRTVLSIFDVGLDPFTGTTIYLEPHRQNDFAFKPAEFRNTSLRFGQFSMALALQVLLPVIIIFIAFDSFSGERKGGTLKQLYSQGLSFRQLFAGKFIAYGIISLTMLLPAMLLVLSIQALFLKALPIGFIARISTLSLLYFIYLLLFVGTALLVSALCKESKSSILVLLTVWICNTVLIPKWAANAGDNLYPLPTKYDFAQQIKADIAKGVNGHDPSNARAEQLKKQLLAKYKVDQVSELPFNYEGYLMQAGEEYSSRVYDKHFAQLENTLDKQNRISLWCSILDPFLAVKGLSASLSGTDYYTHLDFQKQAERYRREFVQFMNRNMQDHSKLGDWTYKIDHTVYEGTPSFSYKKPSISQSTRPYLLGLGSLLIYSLLIVVSVSILNRKALQHAQ